MGAYTGAIGLIVNIVRNLLLLKADSWKWAKSKVTMAVIILLFAGYNDRIYLGGMEKPAAIHIRCGDNGWLLDQQRTEDKTFADDWQV